MKKKVIAGILIATALCAICAPIFGRNSRKHAEAEPEKEEAQEIHFTYAAPAKEGTLTIYDKNGQVWYRYSGEINVKNSGYDGNPVDIEVYIPNGEEITKTETISVK